MKIQDTGYKRKLMSFDNFIKKYEELGRKICNSIKAVASGHKSWSCIMYLASWIPAAKQIQVVYRKLFFKYPKSFYTLTILSSKRIRERERGDSGTK
ncbi:MAG: hypothetical protein WAV32_10000 [Halobacteriota archaeon]